MGLPQILTPPPGDAGWREYWFQHYQDHLDIVQKLQSLGIPLTVYAIYPWFDPGKDTILELHQQYHDDMNLALGTSGSDLSELDFKKPNEVESWAWLNYLEHQAVHQSLGL